jgi:lipopolysaccharide/colanic/teichoic acid biosynthesis glycosyltransferase
MSLSHPGEFQLLLGPGLADVETEGDDMVSTVTAAAGTTTTAPPSAPGRTIWGLDAFDLHTRFWAAHGVQVVRQGEPSPIVRHAELFLLTDPRSLVLFKLAPVMDVLNWVNPQVLFIRLHDTRERTYRERVVTDEADRFIRFERIYDASSQLARVVLTPEREVAELWQSASDPLSAWRRLRRFTPRIDRMTLRGVDGNAYDKSDPQEVAEFIHDLLQIWKRPDATIVHAQKHTGGEIWRDAAAQVEPGARAIGPVWVGAGRRLPAGAPVIGPAVIWDDPNAKPQPEEMDWMNIQPTEPPAEPLPKDTTTAERILKRLFDIAFSMVAILFTLPVYPFIMLAIWFEDGRPFFFAHMRETIGGREFPCLKFRSMRKDAEKVKAELQKLNRADGPQFYIENDPRLTRVGKFLRKYNLDELPQFWNVLVGDMSVVGPRPSPRKENQYCPPWREARLSVRPGVTGLWQVRRTRRAGSDFQEWIKYDIEYVETRTWWLDMKIIWKTFLTMARKGTRQ